MDKPKHEIKKFGGDPLQYQRFVRQLDAQALRYCENDEERFAYLEQFTEGPAQALVSAFAHKPTGKFQAAFEKLKERYGDQEIVATHFLDKVLKFPAFSIGDSDSLEKFSFVLMECDNAAAHDDSLQALGNMRAVVAKLPVQLQNRWVRNCHSSMKVSGLKPRFSDLVEFVSREASLSKNALFGREALKPFSTYRAASSHGQNQAKQGEHKRFGGSQDQCQHRNTTADQGECKPV